MWRLFFLMVLYVLSLSYPSAAQDTADFSTAADFIFNADTCRKGIYRSFREFQLNQPSEQGQLLVKERSTAAQVYLLASRNELYIIDSTGQEKKVKDFWGYCDGRNVYIRDNGLNKLLEIGYYCLYEIRSVSGGPAYNPNPNAAVYNMGPPPGRKKKVVNVLTGQVYDLTVYNLKKYILSKDKDLQAAFNADKERKDRLEHYIHWFNQRNTPIP